MLYLTVFASLRLFGLLPPGAAFLLLLLIATLSAALAVLQNSQSLAILGASGGFLAPILTSTGGGSHVMLFSYYAVLNAGILTIAWYRSWRPLNLVGFAFTFGIGAAWGARFYRPELYASTQPFLLLFFFMYLAIPVLFAQRQATRLERYLDATLVFGVPLLSFGFQLRLMREFEYGAAFSALGMSLVYVVLARLLYTRHRELLRMLVEAFLALGVVFVTLAIPLALDGRWTAAAWALEGAAVVWVGVRQNRWPARAFGLLLQLAAGISFLGSASAARGDAAGVQQLLRRMRADRAGGPVLQLVPGSASRGAETGGALGCAGGVRVGPGVVDVRRPAGDRRPRALATAARPRAPVLHRLRRSLQPAVAAHRLALRTLSGARTPAVDGG